MTREEMRSLKVGDVVRIVSGWPLNGRQNHSGLMDKYLGTEMTVREISQFKDMVYMAEDVGDIHHPSGWTWFPEMIECVVSDDDSEKPGDLESFLFS